MSIESRTFGWAQVGALHNAVAALIADRRQFSVSLFPQEQNKPAEGWVLSYPARSQVASLTAPISA